MYFLLPETRDKNIDDIVTEIRFRSQSLSIGNPFRTIPSDLAVNEGRRLLTPEVVEEEEASNDPESYQAILP